MGKNGDGEEDDGGGAGWGMRMKLKGKRLVERFLDSEETKWREMGRVVTNINPIKWEEWMVEDRDRGKESEWRWSEMENWRMVARKGGKRDGESKEWESGRWLSERDGECMEVE
ncbi:hypothetical protein Pmani_032379 [Petrolisthes manimaculis]|uniref:Uncharacterized protein n=1 Tax=Petrolisthes manimaculis TaxID=1843537 RepID=A0AAE1NTT0_9EUCA|nr:hypothetical protein Pmani_032379 [Petrolisthes manimaculis]